MPVGRPVDQAATATARHGSHSPIVRPAQLAVLPTVPQRRPIYQRLLLPLLGLVLIAVGMIGVILPLVPGFPVVFLGLVFCSCAHQPAEVWMRAKTKALKARLFPPKKSAPGDAPPG
jgi:hypothetical protein